MARDCRGALADISVAQFRQYKVTDHLHRSRGAGAHRHLARPGHHHHLHPRPRCRQLAGDVLTILAKVTTWNTSRDEWAAEVAWQLEAEQRTV